MRNLVIGLVAPSLPLLGLLSFAAAAEETDQSLADRRIPPLKLDRPSWEPLSATDIRTLFSNKQLVFDENYRPAPGLKVSITFLGGCPPIETFLPDGKWRMHFCSRGPKTFRGRWEIEPHGKIGWLCVRSNELKTGCRTVWQGSAADQVFMNLDDPFFGQTDTYNPHRLEAVTAYER